MLTAKTFLVTLFIAIQSIELQCRQEVDWFDNVNTLGDSQCVHTAVIIHQNNTSDSDSVKDELFGKIIGSMSSVIVEMNDDGFELKESDFGDVTKLSTSLLFIFYTEYSGDNVQIYRVMNSINELADFALNYLLIILRTSTNLKEGIEDILRYAWNESIVNIVIVELRLAPNLNRSIKVSAHNSMFLYCRNEKCRGAQEKIDNGDSSQVIIHQFNPFIHKFYHKKFWPEMELFPDFTKNMQKHPLNVFVHNHPPFSSVKWNKHGDLMETKGPDIDLMRTIAKQLNFTPIFKRKPLTKWVQRNSTVKDIIGKMKMFKWDMHATLAVHLTDDIMEESVRSRYILKAQMSILMPKKHEINTKNIEKTLESSGLTLVIIMIIWFAVILLKFDDKIWQLCSIFGLIFSIVVPHQPSRNYERILFLFVAMLGFMYSNDIYASLTNHGVNDPVEKKYETFKDIEDSGLTPIAINVKTMNKFSNEVEPELLWMKNNLQKLNTDGCMKMAILHRNVCCVLHNMPRELQEYQKKGVEQWRFAKPTLWTEDISFRFRQGLPGRKNMNQVIDRCDETGHLGKWYSTLNGSLGHKINADDNAKLRDEMLHAHVLHQLIVVIVFGHSLAILVFIGEVLTHRFRNSFKKKSMIDSWTVYKKRTKKP